MQHYIQKTSKQAYATEPSSSYSHCPGPGGPEAELFPRESGNLFFPSPASGLGLASPPPLLPGLPVEFDRTSPVPLSDILLTIFLSDVNLFLVFPPLSLG
jgi:hypothetical protein